MVTGMAPGEDRGVVGQGHRREGGDGTVAMDGAHLHQAGDIGSLATVGEVVEHVGIRPVEQEGDHVTCPTWLCGNVADDVTVLADEPDAGLGRRWRRAAEELEDGRGHVDEAAGSIDHPERVHPGPGGDEGRPSLHHTQRTVLAEVATLVSPVVRGAVKDHEIRSGGVVEQLCEVLERMGIRVRPAIRVGIGHLVYKVPEV